MSKYPDEVVERVAKVMVEAFESELHPSFWSVEAHAVLDAAGVAEMVEALRKAEAALYDLGACHDANCNEQNCLKALPSVRAVIAKWEGRE